MISEFGIPPKLINLVSMTLKRIKCCIELMSYASKVFYTEQGLRQENFLSYILFNIALEKVIKDLRINTRNTILLRLIQLLAYADDNNIIGQTKQDVVETFIAFGKCCQWYGLNNKWRENQFYVSTREEDVQSFRIGNYTFKVSPSLNTSAQLLPIKIR